MIIGVTGTNLAGKSTVVEMLLARGFSSISLSDILRDVAREQGLPVDRATLQRLGNEFRERGGPGALMQEALRRIPSKTSSYVIDSVRTPGEVAALHAASEAVLIGVDADPAIRFARAKAREADTGRGENALSFDEFMAREALENTDNPHGQQLRTTLGMADFIVLNNGTQSELKARLERLFAFMPATDARKLEWGEYFISIAKLVSKRGSCVKRQVGAIIVRDHHLLSAGYNGTPRGAPNCDAGGCARCNDPSIPSGTRLEECTCVHAEVNAIAQAARNGVSIKDADIYVTNFPCLSCAKLLANVPIKRVFYADRYAHTDESVLSLFRIVGIQAEFQPSRW